MFNSTVVAVQQYNSQYREHEEGGITVSFHRVQPTPDEQGEVVAAPTIRWTTPETSCKESILTPQSMKPSKATDCHCTLQPDESAGYFHPLVCAPISLTSSTSKQRTGFKLDMDARDASLPRSQFLNSLQEYNGQTQLTVVSTTLKELTMTSADKEGPVGSLRAIGDLCQWARVAWAHDGDLPRCGCCCWCCHALPSLKFLSLCFRERTSLPTNKQTPVRLKYTLYTIYSLFVKTARWRRECLS